MAWWHDVLPRRVSATVRRQRSVPGDLSAGSARAARWARSSPSPLSALGRCCDVRVDSGDVSRLYLDDSEPGRWGEVLTWKVTVGRLNTQLRCPWGSLRPCWLRERRPPEDASSRQASEDSLVTMPKRGLEEAPPPKAACASPSHRSEKEPAEFPCAPRTFTFRI